MSWLGNLSQSFMVVCVVVVVVEVGGFEKFCLICLKSELFGL